MPPDGMIPSPTKRAGGTILLDLARGSIPTGILSFAPMYWVAARARRVREICELTRRLWTEDGVSHDGNFYSVADASLQPKPYQDGGPPMYITTTREDQIKWAAERGIGIRSVTGGTQEVRG